MCLLNVAIKLNPVLVRTMRVFARTVTYDYTKTINEFILKTIKQKYLEIDDYTRFNPYFGKFVLPVIIVAKVGLNLLCSFVTGLKKTRLPHTSNFLTLTNYNLLWQCTRRMKF